jgi:hypothetical protein
MSGQWSMHNVWLYVFHNLRAFQWCYPTSKVSATYIGNNASDGMACTNEWQWSINSFCGCSLSYTVTNCITFCLNWLFNTQSVRYVFVFNFTTMCATSYRSHFFLTCSSRVNI